MLGFIVAKSLVTNGSRLIAGFYLIAGIYLSFLVMLILRLESLRVSAYSQINTVIHLFNEKGFN